MAMEQNDRTEHTELPAGPVSNRRILCLDFDGVINSYTSGWQGAGTVPPDMPVPGVCEFIEEACKHFTVAVYSSRSEFPSGIAAMRSYLIYAFTKYFLSNMTPGKEISEADAGNGAASFVYTKLEFPKFKPPAFVTIDDRGLTFTGVWPSMAELMAFQPWNKKNA